MPPTYSPVLFAVAVSLDGLGYEPKTGPLDFIEDALAYPGENDNDTIIEIIEGKIIYPIYKWCKETDSWHLLN